MIHPGLAALEKWEPIEYAAGYRARLATIPDSEIAHHCWRCGTPTESNANRRPVGKLVARFTNKPLIEVPHASPDVGMGRVCHLPLF
jgi:hypothetical protein